MYKHQNLRELLVFNIADKTQTNTQGNTKGKAEFVWTDDEIESLHLKQRVNMKGFVKAKYQKIMEIYVERYSIAIED